MADITQLQSTEIIETGRILWNKAEPGYHEYNTHEYLAGCFKALGFTVRSFEGIPGFIAGTQKALSLKEKGEDQEKETLIALIADMDALPLPGSPDDEYIHSCGHHMQMTNLYGAARILLEGKSPAIDRIVFIAAPAEEYIDFEKRRALRNTGVIRHFSGKQELIERGIFQGISKVVSTHGAGFKESRYISSVRRMSGFEVLKFRFRGRASHAGAQPHKGINAQNAASLFLQACAFLRETFAENEHIRIHPILTLSEGQSVNIIPDTACVETYVRGAAVEAVQQTVLKLQNAADGCALSIGASVTLEKTPGYAPFAVNEDMHETLRQVVENEGILFIDEDFGAASSDMGDVSQLLPSVMLGLPGANGLFHNPDFRIIDEEAAFVLPSLVVSRYLEALLDLGNRR